MLQRWTQGARKLDWAKLASGPFWLGLAIVGLMSAALIPFAADSRLHLFVFNTDEFQAVLLQIGNVQFHDLNPRGFYYYGYLYHSLAWLWHEFVAWAGVDLSERLLAINMRGLSLLSAAVTIYLLWSLICDLMPNFLERMWLPALGCALLGLSPQFVEYSIQVHPDTLQLALILGSLLVAARGPTWTGAMVAFGLAGLAFGTKYSGVMVLPFLGLPYAVGRVEEVRGRWQTIGIFLKVYTAGTLVFLLCWLMTNPYVIPNWSEFVSKFLYVARGSSIGFGRFEPENPFLWIQTLTSQLGWLGGGLVALGLVAAGWQSYLHLFAKKSKRYREWGLHETLWSYLAITSIYVFFFVNAREPRYIFPQIAVAIALAINGWDWLLKKTAERSSRMVTRMAQVAVYIICLLALTFPLSESAGILREISKRYQADAFKAANYIENTFAVQNRTLSDWYTMALSGFERSEVEPVPPPDSIVQLGATIVQLSKRMTGSGVWPQMGTRFSDQKLEKKSGSPMHARNAEILFNYLLDPKNGWRLGFETPDILVFVNAKAKPKN